MEKWLSILWIFAGGIAYLSICWLVDFCKNRCRRTRVDRAKAGDGSGYELAISQI